MEESIKDNDCLLAKIAGDNEQAFEELFNAYKNKVYSIALAFTENKTDAEEIVQDVFSRIWKYRKNLPGIENFPAWIITVTRHRSLTELKKIASVNMQKKALLRYSSYTSDINAEHGVQEKELQTLLHDALNLLTPQQRKIFELSRLQGLDRKVVARTLDLSPATVSVHLTIALRTVRTFLHEHQYETLFLCLFISIL